MRVYILFRMDECLDCGKDDELVDVFGSLVGAMAAAPVEGTVWIETHEGDVRRWTKHRGSYWIEEWEVVDA